MNNQNFCKYHNCKPEYYNFYCKYNNQPYLNCLQRCQCNYSPGPMGPAGNAAALTITPLAGGTRPVSAHLVITQIQ